VALACARLKKNETCHVALARATSLCPYFPARSKVIEIMSAATVRASYAQVALQSG